MNDYERLQELLLLIKRHYCRNVAAQLARATGMDTSYVNRLFYPESKAGAKGIGLKVMKDCSKAFNLPSGFWDMSPDEAQASLGQQIVALPDADPAADDITISQYDAGGGWEDHESFWLISQGSSRAGTSTTTGSGSTSSTTPAWRT